jgi:hypothetical protein
MVNCKSTVIDTLPRLTCIVSVDQVLQQRLVDLETLQRQEPNPQEPKGDDADEGKDKEMDMNKLAIETENQNHDKSEIMRA